MQSNYAIFQKQPNTVGSFLQQGIGGLLGPRVTTDINDAAAVLQSNFTDLNSLAPIILDNPTDVFANIIAENQMLQPEGPRIFPPTHGDPLPPEMLPAPIDLINNMYQEPITDDPFQYAQPEFAPPDTRPPIVQEEPPIFYEDPIIPDPPMVVQDEVPGVGYIEDPMAVSEPPVAVMPPVAVNEPIGQPIDTGTNPFYTGATNVAQPPSMTPVAPSFSLDVGMGGYGTPTNTAGFGNYDVGNIGVGGMGGFNIPTPTTNRLDYFDNRAATTATPQTTATPLPTVNSFAGFNGFGGFGGF